MAKESGKRQRDSMGARRGGRYSVSLSCLGDLPWFLCFHVSCSMRFQLWFLIGSFICQMKNCISWVLFTIPCYYSPFWNAEDAVNNYVSWPSKNYPKKVWCPSRHAPENIENPSGPAMLRQLPNVRCTRLGAWGAQPSFIGGRSDHGQSPMVLQIHEDHPKISRWCVWVQTKCKVEYKKWWLSHIKPWIWGYLIFRPICHGTTNHLPCEFGTSDEGKTVMAIVGLKSSFWGCILWYCGIWSYFGTTEIGWCSVQKLP